MKTFSSNMCISFKTLCEFQTEAGDQLVEKFIYSFLFSISVSTFHVFYS